MKRLIPLCALILALLLCAGCAAPQNVADLAIVTPDPTQEAIPEATEAPTQAPTAEPVKTPDPTVEPEKEPDPTPEPAPTFDPAITVTLAAVGDIMCHHYMLLDAYDAKEKTYDFHSMLADIAPYLSAADLTVGNLETPVAGEAYSYSGSEGTLIFNAPLTFLDALQDAGFDVLTLANDHLLDKGWEGMRLTLDHLDAYEIAHTGAYRSQEERDTPCIVNVKGVRIGIIAATYGVNIRKETLPKDIRDVAYSELDVETVGKDIQAARDAGADFVIVFPHWGTERSTKVTKEQEKMAQALADAGADLILGSHPHVTQKAEYLTSADGRQVLCFYSLSNFISNMYAPQADSGYIAYVTLKKSPDGTTRLVSASALPVAVSKKTNKAPEEWDFRVLPVQEFIEDETKSASIYKTMLRRLKEVFEEIPKLLGDTVPLTKNVPEVPIP